MPKPEAELAQLPTAYRFWPHPATDYIDMDIVIREIDEPLRLAVIAARFETVANVHRAQAEGAAKVAGILRGAKT